MYAYIFTVSRFYRSRTLTDVPWQLLASNEKIQRHNASLKDQLEKMSQSYEHVVQEGDRVRSSLALTKSELRDRENEVAQLQEDIRALRAQRDESSQSEELLNKTLEEEREAKEGLKALLEEKEAVNANMKEQGAKLKQVAQALRVECDDHFSFTPVWIVL